MPLNPYTYGQLLPLNGSVSYGGYLLTRNATLWYSNPAKNINVISYSASNITYSSANTPYSSSTVGLSESGKTASVWTKQAKRTAVWSSNPLATTNLYAYNSSSKTYDSVNDTYDGIVAGQDFNEQRTPTVWSRI